MTTKILPAHIIRLYAWDVLQANTDLQPINGYIPVIALDDEPRVADAQKTYVIYGYSDNNDPRSYEIRRGVVAFNVKARSFSELGQITNALSRAFENCDISAAQVNAWSSLFPDNPFHGIRFTTLETIYVEGGFPEKSEGGPLHGLVNVSYEVIINDETFVLPANAQNTLWS
jgi:hypothetical protein